MLVANNILVNPIKGSSHLASRGLIISSLSSKATEAMSMGYIQLVGCKKVNNRDIYVYMKLDSSISNKIKYDIIFQFKDLQFYDKNNLKDGVFKDKTEMFVFSNSPSFVFTYAYSFNKINAIVPKYKHLLGIALSKAPNVRNPNADIGMPSCLFTGLYYLNNIGFFGNYKYQEFLNGKEIMPQSFENVMKLSDSIKKDIKVTNKQKPRFKKINSKNRYKK